jgi:hypothetical protein
MEIHQRRDAERHEGEHRGDGDDGTLDGEIGYEHETP